MLVDQQLGRPLPRPSDRGHDPPVAPGDIEIGPRAVRRPTAHREEKLLLTRSQRRCPWRVVMGLLCAAIEMVEDIRCRRRPVEDGVGGQHRIQPLRGSRRGVGEGHRPFDGTEGLVDNDRRLYLKLSGRRPPGDQFFGAPRRGTDVVPCHPPLSQELSTIAGRHT